MAVGIEQDDLAVLAPDVDDGVASGAKICRTRGVAGDLGDGLVRLVKERAAVARSHRIGNLGAMELLVDRAKRLAWPVPGGDDPALDDVDAVEQHRFGARGSGIYAERVHVGFPIAASYLTDCKKYKLFESRYIITDIAEGYNHANRER